MFTWPQAPHCIVHQPVACRVQSHACICKVCHSSSRRAILYSVHTEPCLPVAPLATWKAAALICLSGCAGQSGGEGSGGGASHAEAEATRELCVRAMVAVYSAHAGVIGVCCLSHFTRLWLLLRH